MYSWVLSDDEYGPALPPERLTDKDVTCSNEQKVYGPVQRSLLYNDVSESESEEIIGPLLEDVVDSKGKKPLQHMELGKYSQNNDSSYKLKDSAQKRESWMLELPLDRTRSLGLGARKFRLHEAPDMSHSYVWTDTPEMKEKREMEKIEEGRAKVMSLSNGTKAKLKQSGASGFQKDEGKNKNKHKHLDKIHDKKREKVMSSATVTSRKYKQQSNSSTSSHKVKSLMEIHQDKRKKEMKKKKPASKKEPRHHFSRGDLQVQLINENTRTVMIKKAQMLNSRFSNGEDKYL